MVKKKMNYWVWYVSAVISLLISGLGLTMGLSEDVSVNTAGWVILACAVLIFVQSLSRIFQGKNPLIFGQMMRPKAEARGTAIWAFFCFFITPFSLNNVEIFGRFQIPLPVNLIELSDTDSAALGYSSFAFIFPLFLIFWIVGLLLSSKIPKTVTIYNRFFISLCLVLWVNFGSKYFLFAITSDKSGIILMEKWVAYATLKEVYAPMAIGLAIIIISAIALLYSLDYLQMAYSNLNLKKKNKPILSTILLVIFLIFIIPLLYAIVYAMKVPNLMVSLINFVPIVLIAMAVFKVLSSLFATFKLLASQEVVVHTGGGIRRSRPASKAFGLKTGIMFFIVFLTWSPFFWPIVDAGENSKSNSIYNPTWNGWSRFREVLEEAHYNVMSVQSSLSTIDQLSNESHIILVVPGPNLYYNPATEIPFLITAFKRDFSLFVCDDHGSTETLLFEMFISSMAANAFDITKATPLTFFPKGILYENGTIPAEDPNGEPRYWRNNTFPIISDFGVHPITEGINKVVLGQATATTGGSLLNFFGWTFLGQTSAQYSYIDMNDDGKFDPVDDSYKLPSILSDILGAGDNESSELGLTSAILETGWPLGGMPQTVFSAKDLGTVPSVNGSAAHSNRIFAATDATWLDNELTSLSQFDNIELAMNAIEWLDFNRSKEDVIIVFDEGHLAPDSTEEIFGINTAGRTEVGSAKNFGRVQSYLNWLSTNPILGLVYPLFALQTLRRWIPKEGNKKKLQLRDLQAAERERSMLKFRTSSFFAQKINWYRQHKKYNKALIELYRRLERKINMLLGDSGDRSIAAMMNILQQQKSRLLTKNNYNRIKTFLETMTAIKRNKKQIKEEGEFNYLFSEMSWVNDSI